MADDSIEAAILRLHPIARRMLGRSLLADAGAIDRLGGDDSDEADRLDVVVDKIAAEAIDQIAVELAIGGPDARARARAEVLALGPEIWHERSSARAAPAEPPVPGRGHPTETAPSAPARGRRPARREALILLGGLILVGAAALFALLSAGSGDDAPSVAAPEPPVASPASPDAPPPGAERLRALPGTPSAGLATTSIGGGRLVVELRGLDDPRGVYTLWLYDSVIDSRPIGSTGSGDGRIAAALGSSASAYRYLDLSVERSAGGRLHSGRSVRRIALSRVLRSNGG